MVAGCIQRGFLWALGGRANAMHLATKAQTLLSKSFMNFAIWDMPPIVRASPKSVRPMRFDFL
ncbi:MAG: hypothetical protein DMG88_13695 [Acidobacteria bacterium]|nr:MAG: hypothetical protein DMG88_13695 [Acidobacteriota bacterium]